MVYFGIAMLTYFLDLPGFITSVTGIICILIFVVYSYTHGGEEILRRLIQSLTIGQSATTNAAPKPLQIAEFFYILDDPAEPDTFQTFLDDPIFPVHIGNNQQTEDVTPAQYVELFVFENIREIQTKFGGAITVDANLKRGSLIVDLQFFLDAYDNISKYNDAILGVMAFQNQIRSVIRKVSGAYRRKTERNIQIDSNESVKRRNEADDIRRSQAYESTKSPNPVSITNTVSSAQPQKDTNLTLNVNTSAGMASGCLSNLITIAFFLVMIVVVYYWLFELPDARQEAWSNLLVRFSVFLHDVGVYIQDIGDTLQP